MVKRQYIDESPCLDAGRAFPAYPLRERPGEKPPQLPLSDGRVVATPQRNDALSQGGDAQRRKEYRENSTKVMLSDPGIGIVSMGCSEVHVEMQASDKTIVSSNAEHSSNASLVPRPPSTGTAQRGRPRPRTPSVSTEVCQAKDVNVGGDVPSVCDTNAVAEMWLRLARIALLTLPNARPRQQASSGKIDAEKQDYQRLMERLETSATWLAGEADIDVAPHQMLPEDCSAEHETEDSDPCEQFPHRYRNGHFCLGDVMDESITWLEPSPESEPYSPKAQQPPQMQQEQEDDEEDSESEGGDYRRQVLKAMAKQQNAPGIVNGMPKNLSF